MSTSSLLRQLLVTSGVTLAGSYAGLIAAQRWRRHTLPPSTELMPALNWMSRSLETPAGRMHYYHRPGHGSPVVLLHNIGSAASIFEMKPIALYLEEETDRPLYAVDWLGFGRSDRPPLSYTPDVYGRQLYQVLTDLVDAPASVVALSLGCEYAAWMGLQAANRIERLVLISPTGFAPPGRRVERRGLAHSVAARSGLFEFIFAHLTQRPSLQDFYECDVFLDPDTVPDSLVDYTTTTSRIRGAHHAPRQFILGRLFLDEVAEEIYGRLYRPTLLVTPATPGPTSQRFDDLSIVLNRNRRYVSHRALPGGLMPHWEAPDAFFDVLTNFLQNNGGA